MKTFQYCAFLGLSFILCACNTASTQLTASNRAAQTTQNTPVEITLIATGGKPQELTYQVNPPTNGTLTGAAPSLTYIPATDFTGTDQFTFTVTKGTEVSNTATITISVTSLSLTAQNQSLQTIQNTPIDITLGVIGSGANHGLLWGG